MSFFIDQRNSEASGTAQREKAMCARVVYPASCPGWHRDWDISVLLFLIQKVTKPVSTHLCCQRPCRSPLLHPNHPIIPQILPLRALSAVGDPLLIFVHLCRQESQAHPQVYMAGCDGLVLPADVFTSLQAQGQILVRSGVSVLLLSLHTLPNWAKFATSC